ncbi:MAG: hypothetical protein HY920_09110 [Elusimicrobia bacterium]|nr:hypothetical protein [Elusimicrobiota bacterium]
MTKKLNLVIGILFIFMLVCSLAFGEDKKLHYGTGIEYFASDRIYDTTGQTIVTDGTVFEFRIPLYLMYQYSKFINLKLTVPYVYRKAEYINGEYDRLGKGVGDIDLSDEIVLKEETERKPLIKSKFILTFPTGTDNIQSCDLGPNELPTGGPLFGSEAVYWYGRTYNLDLVLLAEKTFDKNKYRTNLGYKVTFPTSSTGYRIKTGNVFHFSLGYQRLVAKEASIGIGFETSSAERIKMDSTVLNYSSGITGTLLPDFKVALSENAKLGFSLKIPVFGKNEYKGVGYAFNIIF